MAEHITEVINAVAIILSFHSSMKEMFLQLYVVGLS